MSTTTQLRSWWAPPCSGPFTRVALHGDGIVSVRPAIVEAVHALNAALAAHDYRTRRTDTGAYNCRRITGGTGYSLHAYGTALDLNWGSNPYGPRLVTDMPREMVAAIKAIRTRNGKQVWRWGGDYSGNKDAMHYEIVCHPSDLATGIDPSTVPGARPPQEDDDMALIVRGESSSEWWITDGLHKDYIETSDIAAGLVFVGLARWNNDTSGPFIVNQPWIDSIPRIVKPESVAAAVIAALPPAQAGTLTAAQVADEIAKRLA